MAIFSRTIARCAFILLFILLIFNFYTNVHTSSGIPFWDDDWDYFFGNLQGLHVPLTLNNLFAKQNDYIAPLILIFSHTVWKIFGANLLVFRFLTWILFGLFLAIYLRLLLRLAPEWGWATAVVSLILLSTANAESFYFQHLALSQLLFFLIFISYLYFSQKRNLTAEILLLFLVGSFGIVGTGYILAMAGYAFALAIAGWSRNGVPAFLNARFLVVISVGLATTAAISYLTFADSQINHTGQELVLPWNADFWLFLFSSFSSALGFSHDMPSRYFLALGFLAFILYAGPICVFLGRSSDQSSSADFALGSFLAGTIALAMMTAAGRAHFCGANLADITRCGATPRYAFLIILALPAAIVALARAFPRPTLLRPIAVGTALTLLGAGYLVDGNFHLSLARWDFSPITEKVVERDTAARFCLAEYLELSSSSQAGQAMDWHRPLICPTISRGINITPRLQTAFETGASFLKPILADVDRPRPQPSLKPLLSSTAITDDGDTQLAGLTPATNEVAGYIDLFYDLKDGSQAAFGWAADVEQHEPVSHLLAVMDGRIVAVGFTGIERPDVATSLGDPRLKNSGFAIPLGTKAGDGKVVRLFAVTQSNKFTELKKTNP